MHNPLNISRHTAAKVLSYVVTDFFPGAQLAGTEITSIGFHCDFALTQPLDEKALPLLEERMRGAIKADTSIKKMDMMRKNAAAFFKHHKQYHLADLTLQLPDDMVEVVEIGHFHDLSFGECASSTAEAGAIKLLKITPLDETVRIEGTCFPDNQQLKQFLKKTERAKKSDHRLIGPEMRLFEESDRGWMWFPKGMFLKNALIAHWRSLSANSQPIDCGSNDFLYFFKKLVYSPEELPLSFAELRLMEGEFGWGLFETPRYIRDEVHLISTNEDLYTQLISSLHFINKTAKIFSFEYRWHLQVPAQKNAARKLVEQALHEAGCEFSVSQGEKLNAEMHIIDLLGRSWPAGGIHMDQGVLTRSLYGSLERYIALFVEQYAGKLPLWLAPEQVRVVSIGEKPIAYAKQLFEQLRNKGFRVGAAYGNETLGAKVHAAEKERIPYLVIVGDKEEKNETVTMRSCYQETVESGLKLDDIVAKLSSEVDSEGLGKLGE